MLARYRIVPRKRYGQNFLHDGNTLRCIAQAAQLKPGEHVVEIGSGTGALTELIIAADVNLTAIEYDARLAPYLREKFRKMDNFKLIQADAARVDFDDLTRGEAWICCANLPYSVSTVIIGRLLGIANLPRQMTLLLQREMGERICSPPNNKTYGSLSVRCQSLYKAEIVRIVSPNVFWPRPDVDSALVRLTLREDRLDRGDWVVADELVRHCFAQRRKTLLNRLRAYPRADDPGAILESLGIAADARPENLSPQQFKDLASLIRRAQP